MQNTLDSQNADENKVRLNKITAYGRTQSPYQSSAGEITRSVIESNPNGNGDITSILKLLPNVQFNNASGSSATPGEISPANISISGGVPYQNSFQLDGFEMNNDLDPAGSNTNLQQRQRGGMSQGLNIDTSLLDSIVVQDSNISAAYGRFSGGVIEANIRKPRTDGWHAGASWQYTQDKLTNYHLYDSYMSNFANGTNENYQDDFSKHILRANVEGYVTKNLGIVAAFSTARSSMPNTYTSNAGTFTQDQKRVSDNYLIKLHYNPTERFTLEANLTYAPQDNTYFTPNFKNSRYRMRSGGLQGGLKALYNSDLGLWTTSLGYSRLENSRRSDVNYYTMLNGAEGQFGSVDQIQNNLTLKSDMQFNPIEALAVMHAFRVGAEAIYQDATRDRIEDSHMYIYGNGLTNIPTGQSWNGLPDSFGFISANATQYYQRMGVIKAGKTSFSTTTYGLYAEDDVNADLGSGGALNARLGVRLDGDNYMNKHKFAPRFSLSYIAPWEESYKTQFTFGANRYYSRNLLAYRFYADAINSRVAYCRSGVNDAWQEWAGAGTCTQIGPVPPVFSNGIVTTGNRLDSLDVPYDDELMFGISQNLFGLFSANAKYIHREGKDQINTILQGNTQYFGNGGRTRANIFTLSLSNIAPIETKGVRHHYLLALDWSDTKRNFNTHSADYSLSDAVAYNGAVTTYANMPAQNYNQPWTLRLNTTHSFNISRTKWVWSNFLRYRGSVERVVLESLAGTGGCTAGNLGGCDAYSTKKIPNAFTWDMRLGFEVDVWRKNTLYVNVDIYNLLDTKNVTTLSGADGVLLYGIPSNAAVMAYELGRQIWVQIGYKL
ncbi:TonB-dependent receptor [Helicobacter sp. MIT 00-7814]|uniref:TonB-dependent receptor plug domain-containing protein n=1 Tax=unclassified Helicobacter TaxID=2593540 RepID=UPI000E1EC026|nr:MULTISPECIES: TonB-dependent receptor plug domain-containing protein [unclassified Helicobacter]RDU52588.1 TonB-dependent receptor [Helicobacter sp. MIT 99-10781]RDU52872.1 TonB-dependent receptor [Helicobacter sp. MIT 00-7814]